METKQLEANDISPRVTVVLQRQKQGNSQNGEHKNIHKIHENLLRSASMHKETQRERKHTRMWQLSALPSLRKSIVQCTPVSMVTAPPPESWNWNSSCFSASGLGTTQPRPKTYYKPVYDLRI